MALTYVYYHMWNKLPVQVPCMIQGAWGWCTGMTQRDGIGREVGEGFRMGNTCTPMVDSCQCMAKPVQYCKAIRFKIKQINLYLKNVRNWVFFNNLKLKRILKTEIFRYFYFSKYKVYLKIPYPNCSEKIKIVGYRAIFSYLQRTFVKNKQVNALIVCRTVSKIL